MNKITTSYSLIAIIANTYIYQQPDHCPKKKYEWVL